jgi:hypothetical protein
LFRVEVAGVTGLQLTRMEYSHDEPGGYYSVDGYPLRDGLRAAIGEWATLLRTATEPS